MALPRPFPATLLSILLPLSTLAAVDAPRPVPLDGWTTEGHVAMVKDSTDAVAQPVIHLGPGSGRAAITVEAAPNTGYRLSGVVRCGSGASEVRLGVDRHGGTYRFAASAKADWTPLHLEFTTGNGVRLIEVVLHAPTEGWIRDLTLQVLDTPTVTAAAITGIPVIPERELHQDLGITQHSDQEMSWSNSRPTAWQGKEGRQHIALK